MSPMTFLFVVTILYTLNAFVTLASGFKELKVSTEVRLFQFVLWTGFAIWGWIIYCSG